MEFLAFLFIVIGVVLLVLWLYIVRQGDAEMDFLVDRRSEFLLEELTKEKAVFSCAVPFLNKGTQDGTIMDCYPRHLMPYEYFKGCHVQSRLTLESNQRNDGYWEALIVFKTTGDAIVLTLTYTAEDGNIQQALADLPDMPVDIVYQVVARSDWYITKKRLVVPAAEIRAALQRGPAEQ